MLFDHEFVVFFISGDNKSTKLYRLRWGINYGNEMSQNITYLFGAGASFHACPIWKEQGEKMLELSKVYLPEDPLNFDSFYNPYDEKNKVKYIIWEIGYFGTMAIKYNTIDAYARKLSLNKSNDELSRLKFAISSFFTLWQLSVDLKVRNIERYQDFINRRYITLLAAFLENKKRANPILPSNINIVTWNYDLQFESAYKSFCRDGTKWEEISETLKFRQDKKDLLQVCHLNGYHGYYLTDSQKEVDGFRSVKRQ